MDKFTYLGRNWNFDDSSMNLLILNLGLTFFLNILQRNSFLKNSTFPKDRRFVSTRQMRTSEKNVNRPNLNK